MSQLSASHQKADRNLLAILDSLFMGVMIIDPTDHIIVYANDEAAGMMTRPPGEIIGRVCHDHVCPAEMGKCPITDLGQEIDKSERCVLNCKREKVPIIKTVKWITYNGRPHLLESFLDISAIKEKEKLEGVLEMAGAAAHHLSQPTQVLLSGAAYLKREQFDDHVREMADIMLDALNRLRDLIGRIQSITRYESEAYVQGKRIVDIYKASMDQE
jgi:nitrogen-specific signal transduction histidine kinase